ncbi:zinc-binding dehydrogenase [Dactylosporangium sp. CA-092794]|uniref:zinc-binding dehydrogenase n=1 Tax=Dactylosporangium sp. CA-092794 TaxID=3239929 RepID=UPI003D8BBEE4
MNIATGVRPGETVLVTAAAGRIGSVLAQLAAAAGARVVAAVGGPAKRAATGADVDYLAPGWAGALPPVDVALDAVGGAVGAEALRATRAGGRFGIYGFTSGEYVALDARDVNRRGLTVVGAMGLAVRRPVARQRAAVRRALTAGLVPRVHAVHPLEAAAAAHEDLEQRRNIGAVLLSLDAG